MPTIIIFISCMKTHVVTNGYLCTRVPVFEDPRVPVLGGGFFFPIFFFLLYIAKTFNATGNNITGGGRIQFLYKKNG